MLFLQTHGLKKLPQLYIRTYIFCKYRLHWSFFFFINTLVLKEIGLRLSLTSRHIAKILNICVCACVGDGDGVWGWTTSLNYGDGEDLNSRCDQFHLTTTTLLLWLLSSLDPPPLPLLIQISHFQDVATIARWCDRAPRVSRHHHEFVGVPLPWTAFPGFLFLFAFILSYCLGSWCSNGVPLSSSGIVSGASDIFRWLLYCFGCVGVVVVDSYLVFYGSLKRCCYWF
jgi:hypothetical protein